jgi:hypothetical protein
MSGVTSKTARKPVDWWLWYCLAVTVLGFVGSVVVRNWPAAAVTGLCALVMVAVILFIMRR